MAKPNTYREWTAAELKLAEELSKIERGSGIVKRKHPAYKKLLENRLSYSIESKIKKLRDKAGVNNSRVKTFNQNLVEYLDKNSTFDYEAGYKKYLANKEVILQLISTIIKLLP